MRKEWSPSSSGRISVLASRWSADYSEVGFVPLSHRELDSDSSECEFALFDEDAQELFTNEQKKSNPFEQGISDSSKISKFSTEC